MVVVVVVTVVHWYNVVVVFPSWNPRNSNVVPSVVVVRVVENVALGSRFTSIKVEFVKFPKLGGCTSSINVAFGIDTLFVVVTVQLKQTVVVGTTTRYISKLDNARVDASTPMSVSAFFILVWKLTKFVISKSALPSRGPRLEVTVSTVNATAQFPASFLAAADSLNRRDSEAITKI